MHSLSDLRNLHTTCLVIDTASTLVQVGLIQSARQDVWFSSEEDAGQGLFRCLEKLPLPLKSIAAIAFCEGPGSLLGIRTAAMALRVWDAVTPRPLYAFQSL
ncbi:MAG TPA: peptidase M22, partial [Opitutaceae bacterium]|nr:peptidase M22 [Opitutaceae bacterium]